MEASYCWLTHPSGRFIRFSGESVRTPHRSVQTRTAIGPGAPSDGEAQVPLLPGHRPAVKLTDLCDTHAKSRHAGGANFDGVLVPLLTGPSITLSRVGVRGCGRKSPAPLGSHGLSCCARVSGDVWRGAPASRFLEPLRGWERRRRLGHSVKEWMGSMCVRRAGVGKEATGAGNPPPAGSHPRGQVIHAFAEGCLLHYSTGCGGLRSRFYRSIVPIHASSPPPLPLEFGLSQAKGAEEAGVHPSFVFMLRAAGHHLGTGPSTAPCTSPITMTAQR